jgi:hypothetical protein
MLKNLIESPKKGVPNRPFSTESIHEKENDFIILLLLFKLINDFSFQWKNKLKFE